MPLTPLEAAERLRQAKQQLHNDLATVLEAFTADTGLRVSNVGCHSEPSFRAGTSPVPPSPDPALTDLDPDRPYRYTVATFLDL